MTEFAAAQEAFRAHLARATFYVESAGEVTAKDITYAEALTVAAAAEAAGQENIRIAEEV